MHAVRKFCLDARVTPAHVHVAQVTRYLGYSSLKDFFPTMEIRPNPGCANALCAQRQAEAAAAAASPEARRMTWLAHQGC